MQCLTFSRKLPLPAALRILKQHKVRPAEKPANDGTSLVAIQSQAHTRGPLMAPLPSRMGKLQSRSG